MENRIKPLRFTGTLILKETKNRFSEFEFKALQKKLSEEGQIRCQILSDSMLPVLATGDVVTIEPILDYQKLNQFDVIVYFNGNVLICHYFLKINRLKNSLGQDCLITKGLFAKHWDLLVPVDQVLGICTDVKISPLLKMREKIRMAFKK
jgi:signal peptidase I